MMSEKDSYRVIEVSKILGVSKVTVYKKIENHREMLSQHLIKKNGVLYVSMKGVEELRNLLTVNHKKGIKAPVVMTCQQYNGFIAALSNLLVKRKAVLIEKEKFYMDLTMNVMSDDRRS